MRKPISQREARRLRKRVADLATILAGQRNLWRTDYPGGVHLDTISVNGTEAAIVRTARALGHACVVINGSLADPVNVYALKAASP
jgi:tRNA G18 (ribose-2'-O)-methylase SpoU